MPAGMAESSSCKIKTVAVIDTGFGYQDKGHDAPLCQYGHRDFTKDGSTRNYGTNTPVPIDFNGHGTNIVGLIARYAKKSNYCIVVIKYYSDRQTGIENLIASGKALQYVANLKVDYVNYSGGGDNFDKTEYLAVKKMLNANTKIVAAAMNNNKNIDSPFDYVYPAMYDKRIVVVGNLSWTGFKSRSSNYGDRVTRWEVGENQEVYGITMTGTSQSTAIATGKIIADESCDR